MNRTEAAAIVYRRLREMEPGWILAVWDDGGVTVEAQGFRGHARPDGGLTEPIAAFETGRVKEFKAILRVIHAGSWNRHRAGLQSGRWRRRDATA